MLSAKLVCFERHVLSGARYVWVKRQNGALSRHDDSGVGLACLNELKICTIQGEERLLGTLDKPLLMWRLKGLATCVGQLNGLIDDIAWGRLRVTRFYTVQI